MGAAFCRFEEAEAGEFVMRVSAIEGHRLWASTYDSTPNPLVALERRMMRDILSALQPSRVIDVGCGTGQWLLHFQRTGSQVFGCDACREMLSEARKIHSLRGRLVLACAENIPFRSAFADLVLCLLSLAYFKDIDRVFREFARVSKSGGVIAVCDLHPEARIAGWKRSFRLGRQSYEIAYHYRTVQDVARAAANGGLRSRLSQTIYFGMPELPLFQRAGKEDRFWSVKSVPALFAGLW